MTTPYDRFLASLSRRAFLNIAWKLGTAAVLSTPICRSVLAQPLFRDYPFSLGVASGDPLPDGVVLWTRLAPEPLEGGGMPMASVEVEWQVATDESMRRVVRSGVELARPELGHSVHAEVDGLEPGREYWYRFRVGRERSQIGRTRTAPAPGTSLDRLRFATCGCNNYESGYFTAYRHLAEELWQQLGQKTSVTEANFPAYDASLLVESVHEYPISINGKMRTKMNFALDMPKEDIEQEVIASEQIQKWLEGKEPKRVIVVPKKIVNIVV